jgi:hypothetical protein
LADGGDVDVHLHIGGHEWQVPVPADGAGHGNETAHGASSDAGLGQVGDSHAHHADGGLAYLGGSAGEGLIGLDGSGAG